MKERKNENDKLHSRVAFVRIKRDDERRTRKANCERKKNKRKEFQLQIEEKRKEGRS